MAQPSISSAIQKLETELGVTLINCNSKPLTFTDEGERFIKHVRIILQAVDDAMVDMKLRQSRQVTTLHMAWASTAGDKLLPLMFTEFYELFPQYTIFISEDTMENMLDKLLSENLDILYALIPDNLSSDYDVIPIQMCEVMAILPSAHILAKEMEISFEMMAQERILTFPEGSLIRARLKEHFRESHIVPHFHTVTISGGIEKMVSTTGELALMAIDEINTLKNNEEICVRPLTDPITLTKGFILKHGVNQTQPMNDLITFIKKKVREFRK